MGCTGVPSSEQRKGEKLNPYDDVKRPNYCRYRDPWYSGMDYRRKQKSLKTERKNECVE